MKNAGVRDDKTSRMTLAVASANSLCWRKRPGEHYGAAAGQKILAAVELVTDWGTDDVRSRARVPKSFAVTGIEYQEVAHGVAGESESGVGGEHAGSGTFGSELVAPADFAGL